MNKVRAYALQHMNAYLVHPPFSDGTRGAALVGAERRLERSFVVLAAGQSSRGRWSASARRCIGPRCSASITPYPAQ